MADESGKRCEQGFDEAAIDRKTPAKKPRDSGDILMHKTLMLNVNMNRILNRPIFQYAASDIRSFDLVRKSLWTCLREMLKCLDMPELIILLIGELPF